MTKDEINPELKERLEHVYWSIYLYNSSLTELQIISDFTYNEAELKIVNSHPFDFYRVTLQYCFVMEYNKLLEKGRADNSQNISSLYKLDDCMVTTFGKAFQLSSSRNSVELSNLKASKFYGKMRDLRDKKFAHADNHEVNIPFKVKGFRTEDFHEGFKHLAVIKQILQSYTEVFGFEYDLPIPHRDNRTENFIRFHADYQEYYFKNYLAAKAETLKNKNSS
jgi:hypothetical protein